MFGDHPDLIASEPSTPLWRYIDLGRLLFLLEYKALWFAKLSTLDDPYEGFPPRGLVDDMWSSAVAASDNDRLNRIQVADHNTRVFAMGRELLAVSSWHANPIESEAMWRLYARLDQGIAISTTFERLKASFGPEPPHVNGGMVQYVDFESYRPESLNILCWATLKRTAFSHEREFRAIVMNVSMAEGLAIPVDLNVLVAGISVSPASPGWFVDLVRRVCERYGVQAKVVQSSLLRHPGYMQPRSTPALSNKPLQPTSGLGVSPGPQR